jgi:excisionase family DNA binding protein
MDTKPDSNLPFAYRVKDFCARIGISPSTFWKLVSRGEIRVIRIGGRTLVPAAEVSRILSGEAA